MAQSTRKKYHFRFTPIPLHETPDHCRERLFGDYIRYKTMLGNHTLSPTNDDKNQYSAIANKLQTQFGLPINGFDAKKFTLGNGEDRQVQMENTLKAGRQQAAKATPKKAPVKKPAAAPLARNIPDTPAPPNETREQRRQRLKKDYRRLETAIDQKKAAAGDLVRLKIISDALKNEYHDLGTDIGEKEIDNFVQSNVAAAKQQLADIQHGFPHGETPHERENQASYRIQQYYQAIDYNNLQRAANLHSVIKRIDGNIMPMPSSLRGWMLAHGRKKDVAGYDANGFQYNMGPSLDTVMRGVISRRIRDFHRLANSSKEADWKLALQLVQTLKDDHQPIPIIQQTMPLYRYLNKTPKGQQVLQQVEKWNVIEQKQQPLLEQIRQAQVAGAEAAADEEQANVGIGAVEGTGRGLTFGLFHPDYGGDKGTADAFALAASLPVLELAAASGSLYLRGLTGSAQAAQATQASRLVQFGSKTAEIFPDLSTGAKALAKNWENLGLLKPAVENGGMLTAYNATDTLGRRMSGDKNANFHSFLQQEKETVPGVLAAGILTGGMGRILDGKLPQLSPAKRDMANALLGALGGGGTDIAIQGGVNAQTLPISLLFGLRGGVHPSPSGESSGLARLAMPVSVRVRSRLPFPRITPVQAEAARQRILSRMTHLSVNVDPTQIPDLMIYGTYYLKRGVKRFDDWSKHMLGEFGDAVQPHLKTLWMAVNFPSEQVQVLGKTYPGTVISSNKSGETEHVTVLFDGDTQPRTYPRKLVKTIQPARENPFITKLTNDLSYPVTLTPAERASGYRPVSTTPAAEEAARKMGFETVKYGGMNPDAANEVNRALFDLHIRDDINMRLRNILFSDRSEGNTLATAQGNTITLFGDTANPELLNKRLADNAIDWLGRRGPLTADSRPKREIVPENIYDIMIHEGGHMAHTELGLEHDVSVFGKDPNADLALTPAGKAEAEEVSQRAAKDVREYFAEALAAYYRGDPLSKEITGFFNWLKGKK